MPAATLSVARACVSAKTPVRLLHRRLAPSPGRIVVRISCEPEGARKPSEPVEDWSVSEDESGSDFEGEKGGRNVVKDLAQDNSFIGVLVVALGAGLVASANSLLSAFGVEPPRLRRRRIKGMSLPARRQSTNVIRLSDRPIPKLEVPSESDSFGPAAVSRPGGRSGLDSALIQPASEFDFSSTMKVSVGASRDDGDLAAPATDTPDFAAPDVSTESSAATDKESVSETLAADAKDPAPSGLGIGGASVTGKAFSQPLSQDTRPGSRSGDRLSAVDIGQLSDAESSSLSDVSSVPDVSSVSDVSSVPDVNGSTAADAASAAVSSTGTGADSGRPGGRGGDRASAMGVGTPSDAGSGTDSSFSAGTLSSADGASVSVSAASSAASKEPSSSAPAADADPVPSTGSKAPNDPFFTPAGSVGSSSSMPTPATVSAVVTGGGSTGSTAGGSASEGSGEASGDRMTPELASQLAEPATTWPAVDASAAVGGGREKYSAVSTSAPTPFVSAADSAGGGAGFGGGKDMGGAGGGGGGSSGGGGGGSGGDGMEDDGSRARFPWVPVLLFLAAAATYPVYRTLGGEGEAEGAGRPQDINEAMEAFKALVAGGVAAGMSKASDASSTAKAGASDIVKATKRAWGDFRRRAEELVAPVFQRDAKEQASQAQAAKEKAAKEKVAKEKADEAKAAAAAAAGAGATSTQVLPMLPQRTAAKPSQATSTATTTGGAKKGSKGAGWLWYPVILAAVGAAAYVVYKNMEGSEGAGAAATGAATAGVTGSASSRGNTKGASSSHFQEPGPREVSHEVDELYAKFQQRDLQFAELSKNLATIEQQESKLRMDSAADVEAVRQQINEMRQSLSNSRTDG